MTTDYQTLRALSLVDAARHVREGTVSAEALTQAAIDAARREGGALNCILALEDEHALDQARQVDLRRAKGQALPPLAGVPLAHKDVLVRNGAVVTCGSPILKDFRPLGVADPLRDLEAAGSITFATLHLSEFIRSPTGFNPHFGPCRNPWNLEFVSGGSSSGSAAAVAARICYGSLGSDTGGSARIPASMCGVVGLKPTHERISTRGVMPLSWTLDAPGPIARNAQDCAALLDVMRPRRTNIPWVACLPDGRYAVAGMRIGVARSQYMTELDVSHIGCLENALRAFSSLGVVPRDIVMPDLEVLDGFQEVVRETEAASVHERYLRAKPEGYSEEVRWRTEPGFFRFAIQYADILRLRGHMLERFLNLVFTDVDVLLTPTLPSAPPTIAAANEQDSPARKALVRNLSRNTRLFNFLGLPALSVPCGLDARGLPVGMQLIGRPYAERHLFGLAHAYQQVTSWHAMYPATSTEKKT